MKEKIINYIETLEAKAYQSDYYFKQRNDLYIENQNKDKEIERLNKKIEQYENPEDMTLMYMWCDEKAKDEIKRLNNIINELEKYINETKLEEFEKVYGRRYGKTFTQAEVIICNMILNKLQELKGSESNE